MGSYFLSLIASMRPFMRSEFMLLCYGFFALQLGLLIPLKFAPWRKRNHV